jgi:hypothetical protein
VLTGTDAGTPTYNPSLRGGLSGGARTMGYTSLVCGCLWHRRREGFDPLVIHSHALLA